MPSEISGGTDLKALRSMTAAVCVASAGALLVGCRGKDEAPKTPIAIAYSFRLKDDRDSLSTEIEKGSYEVRVDGNCSRFDLKFTTGGYGEDQYDVDELVRTELKVDRTSKWRIKQPKGSAMPSCKGVTLYPAGLAAPAAPAQTTTSITTPSVSKQVERWATKDRLKSIAQAQGKIEGGINAVTTLLDAGRAGDASDVCEALLDDSYTRKATQAIKGYPGPTALRDSWAELLDAARRTWNVCAATPAYRRSVDDFNAVDTAFGIDLVVVLSQADGKVDPKSERVEGFDKELEGSRDATRAGLLLESGLYDE